MNGPFAFTRNEQPHSTQHLIHRRSYVGRVLFRSIIYIHHVIVKVSRGFSRFLKVSQNFSRFLEVSQGFSRFLGVSQGTLYNVQVKAVSTVECMRPRRRLSGRVLL